MDPRQAYKDIKTLYTQRTVLCALGLCLLVSNLFLSVSLFSQKQKTILVPPYLKTTVSLDGDSFSESYIEEMTSFFLYLLLELSFETIPYKSSRLLRHVEEDSYEGLKTYFQNEEKKHKEYNLKTSFTITKIAVHKDKLGADITGILKSVFSGEGEKDSQVSYSIRYRSHHGRLFIKSFGLIKGDPK